MKRRTLAWAFACALLGFAVLPACIFAPIGTSRLRPAAHGAHPESTPKQQPSPPPPETNFFGDPVHVPPAEPGAPAP